MDRGTEKIFVAAEADHAPGGQYGPFKSAGEAEDAARSLGWKWVCIYTYTYRNGEIIDTTMRYYEVDEIDILRRKLVRATQITPLNAEEARYFTERRNNQLSLEEQVQEGVNEIADLATKAAGWTTDARMSAQLRRYSQR